MGLKLTKGKTKSTIYQLTVDHQKKQSSQDKREIENSVAQDVIYSQSTSWSTERLLWLAWIKNRESSCIATLPKEIVILIIQELRHIARKNKKMSKDDFELVAILGKGHTRSLKIKKKDTGRIYCMKIIRTNHQITPQTGNTFMQQFDHPFIVPLRFCFQNESKIYLVSDFVEGGELSFQLCKAGKFDENRTKFYAAQIACAIAHVHSLGMVLKYLKPQILMVNQQGNICMSNFILFHQQLKMSDEDTMPHYCGTPEYLAPELLKLESIGKAVDWWSFGIVVFEMLAGLPPFYSQNINTMYQKILTEQLPILPFFSAEAQSLLQGLLTRDPTSRLGSGDDGCHQIKSHAFFNGIDWEKLLAKEITPP